MRCAHMHDRHKTATIPGIPSETQEEMREAKYNMLNNRTYIIW